MNSPPQIRASVEKLAFEWADTKILLNSQAHFDHIPSAAEEPRDHALKIGHGVSRLRST